MGESGKNNLKLGLSSSSNLENYSNFDFHFFTKWSSTLEKSWVYPLSPLYLHISLGWLFLGVSVKFLSDVIDDIVACWLRPSTLAWWLRPSSDTKWETLGSGAGYVYWLREGQTVKELTVWVKCRAPLWIMCTVLFCFRHSLTAGEMARSEESIALRCVRKLILLAIFRLWCCHINTINKNFKPFVILLFR